MTLTIKIDNAAQYNGKRGVALRKPIKVDYTPLQTDKWGWLNICLQKVSGCGSQSTLLHIHIIKFINSNVIQPGSDPDKF